MSRFHRDVFATLSSEQKQQRAEELAAFLARRLSTAVDFDAEIEAIVSSLREQQHEIWSWDYDDGRQIWGPNYQAPQMTGLVIDFNAPASVVARWIENANPREVRQVFGDGLT